MKLDLRGLNAQSMSRHGTTDPKAENANVSGLAMETPCNDSNVTQTSRYKHYFEIIDCEVKCTESKTSQHNRTRYRETAGQALAFLIQGPGCLAWLHGDATGITDSL